MRNENKNINLGSRLSDPSWRFSHRLLLHVVLPRRTPPRLKHLVDLFLLFYDEASNLLPRFREGKETWNLRTWSKRNRQKFRLFLFKFCHCFGRCQVVSLINFLHIPHAGAGLSLKCQRCGTLFRFLSVHVELCFRVFNRTKGPHWPLAAYSNQLEEIKTRKMLVIFIVTNMFESIEPLKAFFRWTLRS